MFHIYHDDALIGSSALESGDPPMGIAFGQFKPTDAFAPLRKLMKPTRDGAGKEQHHTRYLSGLRAETADGMALVCVDVSIWEYGEAGDPFMWEANCIGIEQPPYAELFPHHVKAYEDQFPPSR